MAKEDLISFLNQKDRGVFHNETDFQIQLACYLSQTGHYDRVLPEYLIPRDEDYPWKRNIYVDIVLEKDGKYYLVELKYKTEQVELRELCFGQDKKYLQKQGAKNFACYDYWRDVKRIEYLRKRYSNTVIGGIALFLTNYRSYFEGKETKDADYINFSIHPNAPKEKSKAWKKVRSDEDDRNPTIILSENYEPEWPEFKPENELETKGFRYCFITVPSEYSSVLCDNGY